GIFVWNFHRALELRPRRWVFGPAPSIIRAWMSELHRRRASAEAGPAAGTKGQNPSIDELETRLKRTVEELEAFTEIGKVLTSTLDIHEVLRRIMEKVHELLKPAN